MVYDRTPAGGPGAGGFRAPDRISQHKNAAHGRPPRPTQEELRGAEALWGALELQQPDLPIRAENWVRRSQNTLIGFVDIIVGDITLHGCAVHNKGESRWIGLPGRPQLDRDGRVLITPKTGKPSWSPTVSIGDPKARARFQAAAIAAVDALLGQEG